MPIWQAQATKSCTKAPPPVRRPFAPTTSPDPSPPHALSSRAAARYLRPGRFFGRGICFLPRALESVIPPALPALSASRRERHRKGGSPGLQWKRRTSVRGAGLRARGTRTSISSGFSPGRVPYPCDSHRCVFFLLSASLRASVANPFRAFSAPPVVVRNTPV
jgi:hypothetical protein